MVFCLVNHIAVDNNLFVTHGCVVDIIDYEDLTKHFYKELKNVSYDKIMFIALYQGLSDDQEEFFSYQLLRK